MKGVAYPGAELLYSVGTFRILNVSQAVDKIRLNVGNSVADSFFLALTGPEEISPYHELSYRGHRKELWKKVPLSKSSLAGLPSTVPPRPALRREGWRDGKCVRERRTARERNFESEKTRQRERAWGVIKDGLRLSQVVKGVN